MSITDAATRISSIQAQIQALNQGVMPASAAGRVQAPPAAAPSGGSASNFSTMLAQANGAYGAPSQGSTAVGQATPLGYGATALGTSGGSTAGNTQLPAAAHTMLTTGQQAFASELAAKTGLSPAVITAWLVAEENGSAAVNRQAAGNHDWLNIGYTDSGTYGSSGSQWSDPITAADATAGWLKGQDTIPGYGRASSGVQAILSTAGQPNATQIAALQSSGWASSGYPDLPALLTQVGG